MATGKFSARVRLQIEGSNRVRYLKSERSALEVFRSINMRLLRAGAPPRQASLTPVRGHAELHPPADLQFTPTGGIALHRAGVSVPAKHHLDALFGFNSGSVFGGD